MTSGWEAVCDAAASDLTANVPELGNALVHKLAPWDPEELFAQQGEIHLGVWPEGEGETAAPLTTNATYLQQGYLAVVWESADDEETRLQLDYEGAQRLMSMHEAVRSRILRWTRVPPVTNTEWRYQSVTFPPSARAVRYFACRFSVAVPKDY